MKQLCVAAFNVWCLFVTLFRTKNVMGDIMVNDQERDLRKFRKMSCYIMQDDHLLQNLSVHEAMMCSANLKLCKSIGSERKRAVVGFAFFHSLLH
jgi:ABC-type multidrug transport system ATPase subunit